ncbi:unnamed protein product [Plutella xylostella]|uniref:(diamondback moth) hypothetical protein n=1 Tax=Plutella xylostella TaxID=51655 RepID=A0A8S4GAK3_PLUXY|nr:unnamed protein product [Plutella xylostella]
MSNQRSTIDRRRRGNHSKNFMEKVFVPQTMDTIERIEKIQNVVGVLFFQNDNLEMSSVPESLAQVLAVKLPPLYHMVTSAVKEIDVLDDVVALRIVSRNLEIMVVMDCQFVTCAVQKTNSGTHRRRKKRTGV